MRVSMITIFLIILIALVTKSISSQLLRTSVTVRSRCFDDDNDILVIGGKKVMSPYKKGIYAVAITRTFSGVHSRMLHVGVLRMNTLEDQFHDMDTFFQKTTDEGATSIVIFSIGTTHEKGVLERIRLGLISGEKYKEIGIILKKYGMRKFISQAHGIRQPYVLIKNTKQISERTGPVGGNLIASV